MVTDYLYSRHLRPFGHQAGLFEMCPMAKLSLTQSPPTGKTGMYMVILEMLPRNKQRGCVDVQALKVAAFSGYRQ